MLPAAAEPHSYAAAPHPSEAERLAALVATGLLDSPPSQRFDRLTALAADVFNVPTALISLVDANRQWFLSRCGLDAEETPRDQAFCAHALHEDEILVVEDACEHPVFRLNPLVQGEPGIRFYAGAVLRDARGLPLGTLCLIDLEARPFDVAQRRRLLALAEVVRDELLRGQDAPSSRVETELERSRDPITSAFWGPAFFEAINRARPRDYDRYALAYLRIDNLDLLNESFGRMVGDEMLRSLSIRLQSCLRAGGEPVLGRLDGSNLVALVWRGMAAVETADELLGRMKQCLGGPVQTTTLTVEPQLTLVAAEDSINVETVRDAVRLAQFTADRAGGQPGFNAQAVTPGARAAVRTRFELVRDLGSALADDALHLMFQPKIDNFTGQIVGYECLLRWDHPNFGFIPPPEIISIAQEANQLYALERWVIRTALTQAQQWRSALADFPPISVNLTGSTLLMPGFADWLLEEHARRNVAPECLDIEVVESSMFEEFEQIVATMTRIRGLGISFSLDDFGTGFSSLAYLRRLPVSTLKIDKAFVDDVVQDQRAAALCAGIIGMARDLGIQTVAEGVETELQRLVLKALRCDQIQGYLISPPVAAAAVPDLQTGMTWG
ncbi:MAG: sensor domain-containing phosphodiesterase [Pseudomonadota bacterium]